MDKGLLLEKLSKKIDDCRRCDLWKNTTYAVPGAGNPDAKVMFIGEGPGFHEDRVGRPFVGQSGKLLDKMIEKVSLTRSDVFIGNVVKHRAPENRDPSSLEISACNYWLDQQLEIINPKVVVTLGRFSLAKFIPTAKISQVHGDPVRVRNYVVIPMYHPAAALRRGAILRLLEEDFLRNKEILFDPESFDMSKLGPKSEDSDQMSFFN